MPYFENFDEFSERQGCARVRASNGWLFENGAKVLDNEGAHEPPTDPVELLRARIEFKEQVILRAKARYKRAFNALNQQAEFHRMGAGPAPAPTLLNYLKLLAKSINIQEDSLEALKSELPQSDFEDPRTTIRSEQQHRANDFIGQLKQLPTF